jgi:hypothetical protein
MMFKWFSDKGKSPGLPFSVSYFNSMSPFLHVSMSYVYVSRFPGLHGKARMGLSLSLDQGHEGCIWEMLQKTAVQVCTVIVICLTSCNVMYPHNVLQFPTSGNLIRDTDWCLFFRRLKINHDSNEFIFESGTVANTIF